MNNIIGTDIIKVNGFQFAKLIDYDAILNEVANLASILNEKIEDNNNVLILGVMNGALFFFSDLIRSIAKKDILFDIVRVQSYSGQFASSNNIRLLNDTKFDVENKDVIIVDDIFDTGLTAEFLIKHYKKRGAKSIYYAVLLQKIKKTYTEFKPDYACFTIDDYFVIGYGLDYDYKFRNLNDIYYKI